MTTTSAKSRPDAVYISKRDAWIATLLWGGVIMMLVAAVSLWQTDDHAALWFGMPVFFVAFAGFVLWTLYFTRYALTAETLVIRSGPFRWRGCP